MEKKIGTNLNWEKLIDSLSIEMIQKDNNNHSDSKIYENQFDAAKKFVKAMMSYYIPGETEFTSRNHHYWLVHYHKVVKQDLWLLLLTLLELLMV